MIFKRMPEDVDTAVEFLMSRAGVDHQVIGLAGASAPFATSIAPQKTLSFNVSASTSPHLTDIRRAHELSRTNYS